MGLLRAFFQEYIRSGRKSNILWNWSLNNLFIKCRFSTILPCLSRFPRGHPFFGLKILFFSLLIFIDFLSITLFFLFPYEILSTF